MIDILFSSQAVKIVNVANLAQLTMSVIKKQDSVTVNLD